ncbi:MAG: YncE family protein [Alphaproteobacteria bacterium]|nr:YncE family protein [Alphaproteobacteria bacterium]
MNGRVLIVCAAALLAQTFFPAADAAPLYRLVNTIALGAPERWDYATFDAARGRVYVAHSDRLTVVDVAKGVVAGQVGTFPGGTHGSVALGSVGYTDDGEAGVAAAFDPSSLKVLKQLPAAPDADGIVYDPASKHVFVINGDSGSISAIDPQSNTAIATIKIGAGLEAAGVDGRGKLFVDGAEQHDLISIDTRSNTVLAHYAMPGCLRPHGIAVDAKTRRVFVTCINKAMIVLDADTGANLAALPIGASSDGAAFDPKRKLALSSNGDGTLSVIKEVDAAHFVKLGDVATQASARTIALDPATGRVFLPAATIAKIEPAATPGGRPHVTYVPGSLKLLVLEPTI